MYGKKSLIIFGHDAADIPDSFCTQSNICERHCTACNQTAVKSTAMPGYNPRPPLQTKFLVLRCAIRHCLNLPLFLLLGVTVSVLITHALPDKFLNAYFCLLLYRHKLKVLLRNVDSVVQ